MKEGGNSKEYGKRMPAWLKAMLFALLCTVLVIALKECVTGESSKANAAVNVKLKIENDTWNKQSIDSCISHLRSGDLVVRTGRDVTSQMFRQFNQEDQTYSHCGIVMVENGYPYVYHSIGGEDNPDAKLRRDSAAFWFSTVNNLGLGVYRYDMDESQLEKLEQQVRLCYKERKMFDMKFDLQSDERFYCSEFVYKTVNQATGQHDYLTPVHTMGYNFVPVDRLYLNEHAKFVCRIRYK